ncbi:MAG: BlaI/MecI/CopY family transcriptional regulator [Ferruginibacter sp.]
MKEKNIPANEPTRAELEILQVLWKHGPSTVRFVNDTLNEMKRAVQYTSTLKQMQVMVERNMLTRDESSMKHIYHPAIEEQKTKGALLDKMVESMFDGSASNMVMQLLGNKKTPVKELQAIKDILAKLDKDKK